MNALRWGILGAGGIARNFVADMQRNGMQVVAVGARDEARAQEFADEFNIARVHASYESLVADPQVDAIYVATINTTHFEHSLLAIGAGKHVLVEKPFMLNETQARQVFAEADNRGVIVMEAMWTRFLPHMRHVHQLIGDGHIGEVRTIIAKHCQHLPAPEHPRLHNINLGGGALLDLGVYPLSFAIDIAGPATKILTNMSLASSGVDYQTSVIMQHGADILSMSLADMSVQASNTAEIIGSTGSIELSDVWYTGRSTVVLRTAEGEEIQSYTGQINGRGLHFQAQELQRLVAEGLSESPLLTRASTLAVLNAMDTVRSQGGLHFPGEIDQRQ